MFSPEEVTDEYFKNDAKKLNHLVDVILKPYGGISGKDLDDFYSLAGITFYKAMQTYKPDIGNFDGFLWECLNKKIMSFITYRNRQKRVADKNAVSIDTPVSEDGDILLKDVIRDPGTDIEQLVLDALEPEQNAVSDRVSCYLKQLSDIELEIAKGIMSGWNQVTIIKNLGITQKIFDRKMNEMRSYEFISCLF